MVDARLADLEEAWKERETEAGLLAGVNDGVTALCLRIYALEIRLKARICRQLGLESLPKVCKTHDFSDLIIFTGLLSELNDSAHVDLKRN